MGRWWRRAKAADRDESGGHPEGDVDVPTDSWHPYGPDLDERQRGLADELAAEVAIVSQPGEVDAAGQAWPWSLELYDDVRALAGDPAIEALEQRLLGEVGVAGAVSVDREILWIRGDIDPVTVHGWVVAELARTAPPEGWTG